MVKKAKATKIAKKRNGRFMVLKRGGGIINAADKVKTLEDAGKIKKLKPKAKDAPAAPAAT